MVVMSHVGIEPKLLKRHIGRKETEQAVKVIHKKHGNRCGGPLQPEAEINRFWVHFLENPPDFGSINV